VRFQVHRAELPYFATIVDAVKKALGLFLLTHFEPILYKDDPILNHRAFPGGTHFKEAGYFVLVAKPHNSLNARAVVPTAIENDYLSTSRQVGNVPLNVHLGLLALCRCRQRNESEDSRANSLGNSFDDAAFAGGVATFENHHDFEFFMLDPKLQFHELGLQFREMLLEIFAFQLLDVVREGSRRELFRSFIFGIVFQLLTPIEAGYGFES
jgi:hypothetical protein